MSRKRKKRKKRINKKRLFILIIGIVIIICSCFKVIKSIIKDDNSNEPVASVFDEENIKTYEASILAAGDVMVHSPQLEAQYNASTDTYSFDNNFKYVKTYIENADYALANLETTLAGSPYSSYPMFNSPDELADALKNAGFDLISTINNHSFDKSDLGVDRTLSTLKEKGFDTVGTRESPSDNEYIIKNINNIDLGITSYSYGEIKNNNKYLNGIKVSEDCENRMNIFDYSDVNSAFDTIHSTIIKMTNTDMQIVIIHWGTEYSRNETTFQKQLAQKLCDAGVDIIIGSHPHVVEPVETITSTDGSNETLVIYSLGNYISNQGRDNVGAYSEDGLMVNIDIIKESNEDEATIKNVTCIPTWVNKSTSNSKTVYEIIPIDEDENLDSVYTSNQSNLAQSYKNTSSLIDTSNLIKVTDSPFN